MLKHIRTPQEWHSVSIIRICQLVHPTLNPNQTKMWIHLDVYQSGPLINSSSLWYLHSMYPYVDLLICQLHYMVYTLAWTILQSIIGIQYKRNYFYQGEENSRLLPNIKTNQSSSYSYISISKQLLFCV